MENHGTVIIHLDKLIKDAGISKNKLSHRAEMQRTQINNYCNNKVTRLDIDVLARLCSVLHCELSDLLEYIPPDAKEEGI
ncbi:MAG: helix-turn-helix transcriptional regulator [Lachnospiraceae bacterium]|nr:helix-turn-helix transcriptional regulator [Lachnospiraceae bacterium]